MIENAKAKNLCRFDQLLVRSAVGGAGLEVAGGVVMNENDGSGPVSNDIGKYFTRMHRALILQADGYDSLLNDLICPVEGNAQKVFLLLSGNIGHEWQNIPGHRDFDGFF